MKEKKEIKQKNFYKASAKKELKKENKKINDA